MEKSCAPVSVRVKDKVPSGESCAARFPCVVLAESGVAEMGLPGWQEESTIAPARSVMFFAASAAFRLAQGSVKVGSG